jgi:thiamine biosynthesis lipoprotein
MHHRCASWQGIGVCRLSPLAILLFSLFACTSDVPESKKLQGPTMGTRWSAQIVSELPAAALDSLHSSIRAELERINGLMSTWDPTSELSQFNAMQSTEPVELHADTLTVIDASLRVSELTKGAYDVTLGAVIDLWGFGADMSRVAVPEAEALATARDRIGYQKLHRQGSTVSKQHPALRIDLSSLAKGFAVDQIGLLIEAAGIENYIAEIGGEVRTRGSKADGSAWRIGIEQPDGKADAGLAVHDAHMASSGSYRNYREVAGQRYSHIIDGRTGQPITHELVAVTVLHESTMLADAWATALLVLGVDAAMALASSQNLALQLTVKTVSGFKLQQTDSFAASFVQ